jgi:uncharacterized protein YkwD
MSSLQKRLLAVFLLLGIFLTQVRNSFAEYDYTKCPDGYEKEAVRLVNIIRVAHDLNSLTMHSGLMMSSSLRALEVVSSERLTHEGWKESIHSVGYGKYAIGENLARGYNTPAEVVDGWYRSAGHRDNILDKNYNFIGIGCYVDSTGSLWWSQHFGG